MYSKRARCMMNTMEGFSQWAYLVYYDCTVQGLPNKLNLMNFRQQKLHLKLVFSPLIYLFFKTFILFVHDLYIPKVYFLASSVLLHANAKKKKKWMTMQKTFRFVECGFVCPAVKFYRRSIERVSNLIVFYVQLYQKIQF